MKLLLDTNVLIDYYAQREPFVENAILLRIASCLGDVDLWACSRSFPDVEYVLRRAIPANELRQMMSKSLEFLSVCTISASDVCDGFKSDWQDLEDFYIASAAKRIGADYVITRDCEGFAKSDVPALSPQGFFKLMQDEYGVLYDSVDL